MRKTFVTLTVGLIIILMSSCSSWKRQAAQRMTQTLSVPVHRKVTFILTFSRLETSPRRKQIN